LPCAVHPALVCGDGAAMFACSAAGDVGARPKSAVASISGQGKVSL